MRRRRGWSAFAIWGVAGALVALTLLSLLSIGIFILPLAVIALAVAGWRASGWPEGVGLVAGVGATCLVIAFLSRDYEPCDDGPLTVSPGETSAECGGTDPVPWLVVGIALVGASVGAHLLLQRRGAVSAPT